MNIKPIVISAALGVMGWWLLHPTAGTRQQITPSLLPAEQSVDAMAWQSAANTAVAKVALNDLAVDPGPDERAEAQTLMALLATESNSSAEK